MSRPDALATSFRFHEQLESPFAFIRREWVPIAFFGGAFTVLMIAVIFLIDPAFFYPRLETDTLLYFLKAKTFADSGTTTARLAVNLPPFFYASMPGVLRSPFLRLFTDFDDQLRAIQVSNVFLTDFVAVIGAYIFSWVLPRSRHWMAIGFAFGVMLLSPWWLANLFVPLADAPYAAFSLLSMVIAIRSIASPRPLVRAAPLVAFALVFVIAFQLRFTEPVVLILAAALLKGRFRDRHIGRRVGIATLTLAFIGVAFLAYMNREALLGKYLVEPFVLLFLGEKQSIIMNSVFLAVPEQIIPGFALGFSHPPVIDYYHARFSATRMDAIWSAVGATITLVVLWGAWRLKTKMRAELWMLLAVLPVLVAMLPSTSRYFMTYQPFFWIAFYEGIRGLSFRIPGRVCRLLTSRTGAVALATLALVIGLALGLRARQKSSARGTQILASLVTLQYVHGVTGTYRPLRKFLESLPADRSVLTAPTRTGLGRWKAIANLDYYAADTGLVALSKRKDVYLVLECGKRDICAYFSYIEAWTKDRLCAVGEFDYQLVFSAEDSRSEARVFRLRPAT